MTGDDTEQLLKTLHAKLFAAAMNRLVWGVIVDPGVAVAEPFRATSRYTVLKVPDRSITVRVGGMQPDTPERLMYQPCRVEAVIRELSPLIHEHLRKGRAVDVAWTPDAEAEQDWECVIVLHGPQTPRQL